MKIVLKIGTNTLTRNGAIDDSFMGEIVGQIVNLKKEGNEIIIVTSGAIGFGAAELGIKQKVRDVKLRQATAAIGQIILMEKYAMLFRKYSVRVAQLLLSYADFSERKRYLNLNNSLETLLKLGVVPIINENDPVAIDEIGATFGDNDKLSALIASKIEADTLILLTDVQGLYDKNPKSSKDARLIPYVHEITPEMISSAEHAGSLFSKGGMKTKLHAAQICQDAGCNVIIAHGREKNVLQRSLKREIGTFFVARKRLRNKERWILHASTKGSITIDEGARAALLAHKDILPVGIVSWEGIFSDKDIIEIKNIGKAIVNYSSTELEKIKGKKMSDVQHIIGRKGGAVVTRENVVFFEPQ